jgi:hypothetical protein
LHPVATNTSNPLALKRAAFLKSIHYSKYPNVVTTKSVPHIQALITTRSNAIEDTSKNRFALGKGRHVVPFVTKRTDSTTKKRLMVATCSFGLALLCAEVFVRLAPQSSVGFVLDATMSHYEASLFQRHPVQINVLAPNVSVEIETIEYSTNVRTNSLGLRGPDLDTNRDSIRVLTVGDSFTLGLQVPEDQTWQAGLSASLTQALHRPVEVLNAGVDGYGTLQATAQLKRLARATRANFAILAFYLGNDFRGNSILDERRALMRSRPPIGAQDESASRGSAVLAKASRLYATWLAASQVRRNGSDFRIAEYADEMSPFVSEEALTRLIPDTVTAIGQFEAACSELNITCAIILIPPSWVVNRDRTESSLALFGLEQNLEHFGAPAEAVGASTTLPVVDLTEALSDSSDNYLTFDPHWSKAGHDVVANTLHPTLLQLIGDLEGSDL